MTVGRAGGIGREGVRRRLGRGTLVAAAALSPFATHILVATGVGLPIALALATAQWCLALSALLRLCSGRRFGPAALVALAGLAACCGALVYQSTRHLSTETGLLALSGVSHLAINTVLLALFGSTLLPGRTPLVVAIGRRVDPNFTPALARYARQVTWAWCAFFVAQIAGSALLLGWAPRAAWSLFINILDMPLLASMFVAESVVRRMRFPAHPHVTLSTLMRDLRRSGSWQGIVTAVRA